MSEDEDKSTVVLDISTLKSQLEENEDIISKENSVKDLQFATHTESQLDIESLTMEPEEEEKPSKNVYFFSYKTDYFENKQDFFNAVTNYLNEVKDLNSVLAADPCSIIVFYYNSIPKAINQLSMQIKAKFPLTSTIIIAKNLSADKAQQHHNSKYGADSYLNEPFSIEEFRKSVNKLCND